MKARTFSQAQADADNTYEVVYAEVLDRTKGDRQAAGEAASAAYTDAMTAWQNDTPYTDQADVIAARKSDAASDTPQYVSLPDLVIDYEALRDWRHIKGDCAL